MAPQTLDGESSRPRHSAAWLGWLLSIGFGLLAVLLFVGARSVDIPPAVTPVVDPADLVVGPKRVAMSDPPHILVEGVPQNCNGCHQIFKSDSPSGAVLNYHENIHLSHGMNNRCVNCHQSDNREQLTLRDGTGVPFAQTPQLCAQCHGTVYRDWERGTHGKTLGSWVTNSALQRRLNCNECHNPHSPKYEPFKPLPGPNTLRMGKQDTAPSHDPGEKQSPLQRLLLHLDTAGTDHPAREKGHP